MVEGKECRVGADVRGVMGTEIISVEEDKPP